MSVVTPYGAVGRVHQARTGLSEVLLVTDGRFAADVMVERSRVRAVAAGLYGRVTALTRSTTSRTASITICGSSRCT